ncbi:bifunctional biotin--[acetyl-CoA-carboxylase] ligase/biotin operon repressor BirA [Catenovulum sediminis]|uniref:Bifunctional ligase/repressor BirA n=1 Tax=Catenovulum sediminis TaxID=1740262 RepID=A0ABV1RI92_9ALTE
MKLEALLECLCDGHFHSGQDLATYFSTSRASISNWIHKLEAAGYQIHKLPGKGYSLPTYVKPLNFEYLQASLKDEFILLLNRHSASTNEEVKQYFKQQTEQAVLAATDKQTAGRGRRGRVWHSPFAQNLYFSLGLTVNLPLSALSGLSLVVGIAVADYLRQLNIYTELKWPNDIYLDGKKLGGILIELEGDFEPPCNLIVGVGLNVNMHSDESEIDQAWQSLASYRGELFSRDDLLISLSRQIKQYIEEFVQSGMSRFVQKWAQYDRYLDKQVTLMSGNNKKIGINRGIDQLGNLLLETQFGMQTISGGEISLRATEKADDHAQR